MTVNFGSSFENWFASKENYDKTLNGQSVPDFNFMKVDIKTLPAEKKGEAYKIDVLNIAQSRIANYDSNNNGKMELSEYVEEQKAVYQKMFNEQVDMNISGMQDVFNNSFANCDTNKDGSIDDKEMAAVFAYMDASGNDGTMDGKISYNAALGTDWGNKDITDVLSTYKKFIFGE